MTLICVFLEGFGSRARLNLGGFGGFDLAWLRARINLCGSRSSALVHDLIWVVLEILIFGLASGPYYFVWF